VAKIFSPKVLIPIATVVAILVIFILIFPPVVLPEIVIPAERITDPLINTRLLGLPFTLGITNTILASWLTMILLVVFSLLATRDIRKIEDLQQASPEALAPGNFWQNFAETVIELLYNLIEDVAGSKWARLFSPTVMTIFLFIIVSNWMGILPLYGSIGVLEHPHEGSGYEVQEFMPGVSIMTRDKVGVSEEQGGHQEEQSSQEEGEGSHEEGQGYVLVPFFRSAATDLNTTLALAVVSVLLTQYFGVKALGLGYFNKFINVVGFKEGVFMGLIELVVGGLETISECVKILSFAFRLFGNIFAGEVLLSVVAFLFPYAISLPFYGLELFVGFVQALVFMMLTLVFMSMATMGHGSHGEEH
jgi:F-type H+-transporting ATPase subunit a